MTNNVLEFALAYGEAGFCVFPTRPGTKKPAVPNHPAHDCQGTTSDPACAIAHQGWEQRATNNLDRIATTWPTIPRTGVAIACGPSDLLVIDLDTAKAGGPDGTETLNRLEQQHRQSLPVTFTVGTPSGGRHLYYRQPDGPNLRNTTSLIGPRIDTRGAGGYVIAPPSQTTEGNYWIIDDHQPVTLPNWFAELLRPETRSSTATPIERSRSMGSDCGLPGPQRVRLYVATALDAELATVAGHWAKGGSRMGLLRSSVRVGSLVGAGLVNYESAAQALEHAAHAQTTRADSPRSLTEVRRTIRDGLAYGQRRPRQLPIELARGVE